MAQPSHFRYARRRAACHVRRDKAALFQRVQAPPGEKAPPQAPATRASRAGARAGTGRPRGETAASTAGGTAPRGTGPCVQRKRRSRRSLARSRSAQALPVEEGPSVSSGMGEQHFAARVTEDHDQADLLLRDAAGGAPGGATDRRADEIDQAIGTIEPAC